MDSMTTMSTWYQGANLTDLEVKTNSIIQAGCAPQKLHMGISDQCNAPKYR
jgi:hypothetical protein